MGTLYYGALGTAIDIDDRTLAHLKVVIATKLRRDERFTLSWRHPDGQARGRTTVWIAPSIPLRFVFAEPERPELDHEWIEVLAAAASSNNGIELTPGQVEDEG